MQTGRTVSLAACVLLASCNGDSTPTAITHIQPRPRAPLPVKQATPAELTAGMVEAVTIGKSTVPLAMKFNLAARPMLGQPLDVAIALLPQIEANSAAVQVAGSDGLKLASTEGATQISAVDPAQVYKLKVTVTPTAEGVQLLNVNVALSHDEITETRNFSIPVIVATASEAGAVTH